MKRTRAIECFCRRNAGKQLNLFFRRIEHGLFPDTGTMLRCLFSIDHILEGTKCFSTPTMPRRRDDPSSMNVGITRLNEILAAVSKWQQVVRATAIFPPQDTVCCPAVLRVHCLSSPRVAKSWNDRREPNWGSFYSDLWFRSSRNFVLIVHRRPINSLPDHWTVAGCQDGPRKMASRGFRRDFASFREVRRHFT